MDDSNCLYKGKEMWIIDLIQSALVAEENNYRKVLGDVAIAFKNNGFFENPNWHEVINSTFECVFKINNDEMSFIKNEFIHLMSDAREEKPTEEDHLVNENDTVAEYQAIPTIEIPSSNDETVEICNSSEDGHFDEIEDKDDQTENEADDQLIIVEDKIEDEVETEDQPFDNIEIEDDQTVNKVDDQVIIAEDQLDDKDRTEFQGFDNIETENKVDDQIVTVKCVNNIQTECSNFDDAKSKSLKRNRTNSLIDSGDIDENLFTQMEFEASTPIKSSPKKHKPNESINSDCEVAKKYEFIDDLKGAKWSQLCDEVNEKQSNIKFVSPFDQCKKLRIVLEKEPTEKGINVANEQNASVDSNMNSNIKIEDSNVATSTRRKSARSRKKR